ncbi:hypothetical protein SDJN02_21353, partial [Cucurbita argyrosperma subsp. argyrosperma]
MNFLQNTAINQKMRSKEKKMLPISESELQNPTHGILLPLKRRQPEACCLLMDRKMLYCCLC